jgi:hypothetical protein
MPPPPRKNLMTWRTRSKFQKREVKMKGYKMKGDWI